MSRLRKALSFENVLVTIVAFAVLAGGTAFAANQIAKNSVGTKQLKKNSVSAAKLKKNAVTTAKIKQGAVTSAKVKDGAVSGAKLNTSASTYSRIIHKARGTGTLPVSEAFTVIPLDSPAYTQAADEDDFYYGVVDVTFSAGCGSSRNATAVTLVDSPNSADPSINDVVGEGSVEDSGGGEVTKRISLGASDGNGVRFQGPSAVNHTLSLVVRGTCESGGGITASNAAVDVVGVR